MSVYDEEYTETILEGLRRNLEYGINLGVNVIDRRHAKDNGQLSILTSS